jgi:class 3 adenylate cyclase
VTFLAKPTAGDDYFSPALNRAARVMAAGHGGQILLAESAASLLTGVDLVDFGPRRLRDLPGPVGVFQVSAEGLRRDARFAYDQIDLAARSSHLHKHHWSRV